MLQTIQETDLKLFVIIDNLRVHRTELVTAWVAQNNERIELFYHLPSLECNSDEYVNKDIKYVLACYATPRDKATVKA